MSPFHVHCQQTKDAEPSKGAIILLKVFFLCPHCLADSSSLFGSGGSAGDSPKRIKGLGLCWHIYARASAPPCSWEPGKVLWLLFGQQSPTVHISGGLTTPPYFLHRILGTQLISGEQGTTPKERCLISFKLSSGHPWLHPSPSLAPQGIWFLIPSTASNPNPQCAHYLGHVPWWLR